MSDTSVTTIAPPPAPPMPNDSAARSAMGEILEPAQIAAQQASLAQTKPPATQADGTPAATSTPPEAKPATEPGKAPDTYTAFTAPEGYTIDPKTIEAAAPIFKELGLTQEQGQKLVDFHTSQMISAAKAPAAEYEATRTDWQAKTRADPDLAKAVNGDKTGLEAVKLDISRALNAMGDAQLAADFKAAMDVTGFGDHPAAVKTLWKLAGFITEGKHVTGQQPSVHGQRAPNTSERPSAAQSLYPNHA